ncbi:MAG: hypothetical protein HQL27_05775 [Candidatus Omnitrophica bacterium]|nr:hypothetical protein [Candidatus Omnitrophota bacterium]
MTRADYKIRYLTDSNPDSWDDFCLKYDNAWFWHTTDFQRYILDNHPTWNNYTKSFMVTKNEKILAVVPVIIGEKKYEDSKVWKEISYSGWSTPFAAVISDIDSKDKEMLNQTIIDNINLIAKEEGVARAVFSVSFHQKDTYEKSLKKNELVNFVNFQDISERTLVIDLSADINSVLSSFRERYARYIRANEQAINIEAISRSMVADEVLIQYKEVSSHDPSQEFHQGKAEFIAANVEKGKGVLFKCSLAENRKAVGFLFVIFYKKYAFDFAVAVDKNYENLRVSHAMKKAATIFLKENGCLVYELGVLTEASKPHRVASDKQKGITNFKRGFANKDLPLFIAEKFYSEEYFKYVHDKRIKAFESDLFSDVKGV